MNINHLVTEYFQKKNHPLTAEMQRIREIILASDTKVEETIKWSSPTFMYKGNMASFFMNAKKHISLMFHNGAFIKDDSGLLSGDGKQSRVAKFADMEDIESRKEDLENIVREWIRMNDD